MPYLKTAESWLTQSALLLQARPNTTRITTKYSINPPIKPSKLRSRRRAAEVAAAANDSTPIEPKTTGATTLILKTYDAVSGVTLKYKTDKAADVGRLIASLGRLGRNMAALPETTEVVMDDAVEAQEESAVQTPPIAETKPATAAAAAKSGGPPPAGKKGKKKGKK